MRKILWSIFFVLFGFSPLFAGANVDHHLADNAGVTMGNRGMEGMMEMMNGGMMGGGMMGNNVFSLFYILWVILLILGIILLGALLVKILSKTPKEEDSALKILKERYAKGEISKKEFEERKKDLL